MSDRAQLEAAYQELVAFTYSATQELRPPLKLVHGLASILQHEHDFNEEVVECLRTVAESAQHMERLLENLTAFLLVQRVIARHGGRASGPSAESEATFHFAVPAMASGEQCA
jgi:light-regulated signal transduction histidine kinase (bacteriophytochrome)